MKCYEYFEVVMEIEATLHELSTNFSLWWMGFDCMNFQVNAIIAPRVTLLWGHMRESNRNYICSMFMKESNYNDGYNVSKSKSLENYLRVEEESILS